MTRYQIVYYDRHGNAEYRVLDGANGDPVDAASAVFADTTIAPNGDECPICPVIAYPAVYVN